MAKSSTPEYRVWVDMKTRCYNSNAHNYKYYGAKGVTICDRWFNSFDNFFEDMGKRPKGYTLGRKNDSGNYEPSNCEWEPKSQQSSQAFRGEKNRHNKLTDEQIECLRALWQTKKVNSKLTTENISKHLNVTKQTINNIVSYRTWVYT